MNQGSFVIARRALAGLASALVLAVPAQAGAATSVSVSGGELRLIGAVGSEASRSTVTAGAGGFVVNDAGADLTAGSNCTQNFPRRVTCTGPITTLFAQLDGGGDILDSTAVSLPATVSAGSGNDVVMTGGGDDNLDGGGDHDWLNGGAGDDSLNGGLGTDGVGYWNRIGDVTVSLAAGTGGSTAGGESDTIANTENVVGGSGDDLVIGNNGPNMVGGGYGPGMGGVDGDDVLRGMGGADTLVGDAGNDTADYSDITTGVNASLDGVANDPDSIGSDVENLTGGAGDDTLTGSAQANKLTGGAGADTITGLAGADTISARDGVTDAIDCGADADTGLVDTADSLTADCESAVERPAPTPPPTSDTGRKQPPVVDPPADDPPAGDPPADDPPADDDEPKKGKAEAPVKIKTPKILRINSKGVLPVKVACTAATGTCRGKIELFEENGALKARTDVSASRRRKSGRKRKAIRLGSRKFNVAAGKQKTVPLRLNRNGRRRVIRKAKGRKRRRGKIVITMKAPNGSTVTSVKNVTIATVKERRGARRPAGRRRGR